MLRKLYLLILLFFISTQGWASSPLLWNKKAIKKNCPINQTAIWVNYPHGADCIRYFSYGNLYNKKNVLIVLSGDRDAVMKRKPENIPNNTIEAQQHLAKKISKKIKLPVIIIARPGTYGSSGNHARRRQKPEFLALDAALESLKQRYHIHHFILYGHSGGATAAAAILTFGRNDISCAILTSGAYDLLERAERLRVIRGQRSQPNKDITGLLDPYDPLKHISGIVQDSQRNILIIGNKYDKVTPFDLQAKFSTALQAAGHNVSLLEWVARKPQYHNIKTEFLNEGIKYCNIKTKD